MAQKSTTSPSAARGAASSDPRRPLGAKEWLMIVGSVFVATMYWLAEQSASRPPEIRVVSAPVVGSSTPGPVVRSTLRPRPTIAAGRTAAPRTPRAGVAAPARTTDAEGDVRGPSYADVVAISAVWNAGELVLRMTLAGTPDPLRRDEVVYYMFHVDIDADGSADLWVDLENSEAGRFYPVLTDLETGMSQSASAFPGSGRVRGQEVMIRVDADAVVGSEGLAIHGLVQRSVDFRVLSEDQAPEGRRYWLRVGS